MELVEKGVLCTLHRVYDEYADIPAVAAATARVVASLSVNVRFHRDIFEAGKSLSLSFDVKVFLFTNENFVSSYK